MKTNRIKKHIPKAAAFFSGSVGLIVIIGYLFFPEVKLFTLSAPFVKFNTALCLFFSAIALYHLENREQSALKNWFVIIPSLIVLFIAGLTFYEYAFNKTIFIDRLFWKDESIPSRENIPGRMNPISSLLFTFLPVLNFILLKRRLFLFVQIILFSGIIILTIYFLAFVAYYNDSFSGLIAVESILSLIVLHLGTFFSYPLSHLKISFQKRIAGFLLLSILLIAMVFFGFRDSRVRFEDTRSQVIHNGNILFFTQEVLMQAQDIETGIRGFIITGDEKFLEPFTRSSGLIFTTINDLKKLGREDTVLTHQLDTVEALVNENILLKKDIIQLRRNNPLNTVSYSPYLDKGKILMDSIRSIILKQTRRQQEILDRKTANNNKELEITVRMMNMLQGLLILMMLIVFYIIYENSRRRNKAEKELSIRNRELQQFVNNLQKLLNTSLDVICSIDSNNLFTQISETSEKLWGYKPEELIGKNCLDFIQESDVERTKKVIEEIKSGNDVQEFENRNYNKEGKTIPISWTAMWSQEEKIMYCIARDASERKKTLEQLQVSESRLANAQKIARLGNWDLNLRNQTYFYSDEIFTIISENNKDRDQTNDIILELTHPDDRGELLLARKSAIEKNELIDIELRLVLKNDTVCYVNIRGKMVPDEKGTPRKLSGTMQDITQQKQFEIQLQELNENLRKRALDLQSSNAELERFAYVASHDLQEPLRMVSSFLNLLEKKLEGQLDETTRKYIGFAVDGSERMKKLIQDLLQFSRLGTSKEGYSEVDCNEIIKNIGSIFALSLSESKTQLTVHSLPVVRAIQPQLQQVFQNLIGNAIKYNNKEKPHIEVGCYEEDKFWKFYVKDNGIGIEPKFYDKIFIIFQRLHNKSEYSGTGIGLAICKKIVEKHGGQIWVESEADKGSIFYFTIPKHTL